MNCRAIGLCCAYNRTNLASEKKTRTNGICLASVVLFLSIQMAFGQVASRIGGVVRDASQAVIPGCSVTAREVNRGMTLTTITNEVGRYSFPNLTVGEYVVTAEMSGFKRAATAKIKLDVNQSVDVDITLAKDI
jgi:hypothetical protein